MAWDRLADQLDGSLSGQNAGSVLRTAPFSGISAPARRAILSLSLVMGSLFLMPNKIGLNSDFQGINYLKLNTYSKPSPAAGSITEAIAEPDLAADAPSASFVQAPFGQPIAFQTLPLAKTSAETRVSDSGQIPPKISSSDLGFIAISASETVAGEPDVTEYPAVTAPTGLTAAENGIPQFPEFVQAETEVIAALPLTQNLPPRPALPSSWSSRRPDPAQDAGKSRMASRFYAGLHANIQWTGLLSRGGNIPDENLNPMLNIGQAFGISAGYLIKNRLTLETGLVVDSRQGSRYGSTVTSRKEEVPVTKTLLLHYTQIPLTVRIRAGQNAQASPDRASWSYIGGLQYGILRNSRLRVEDKPVSPERNLQQHDLAVLLGMDYDIPLQNRMFVSLGVRGSLGLNPARVTSLEWINRDKHNAVLGFRAAINGFLLPE